MVFIVSQVLNKTELVLKFNWILKEVNLTTHKKKLHLIIKIYFNANFFVEFINKKMNFNSNFFVVRFFS